MLMNANLVLVEMEPHVLMVSVHLLVFVFQVMTALFVKKVSEQFEIMLILALLT